MAKYYQYLQTDHRGEITQLDYIDDMTFPGKELYVFKDGFKCYSELIANPQNTKAFEEGNCVMTELYSPYNKWTFEETHLGPEEKKGVNEDGQKVVAADPYFIQKGEGDMAELIHKPSIRVKATPPNSLAVLPIEPADNYRMSSRFGKKKEEPKQIPQAAVQKPVTLESEVVVEETPVIPEEKPETKTEKIKSPESENIANFRGVLEDEQNKATMFGHTATFEEWNEVFGYLLDRFNESKENPEKKPNGHNPALRNLVDSCQTTPTSVGLKLNINLPVPEFFRLVEMSYGHDSLGDVIRMIVDDIPLDVIRKTISDFLVKKFSSVMNTPIVPAEVELPTT